MGKGTNGRKLLSEKRGEAQHDFLAALDRADELSPDGGSIEIGRSRFGGTFVVNGTDTVRFGANLKLI